MKNTEKWFSELLDSYKDDFEFRLEELVFELTEQISKKLKEEKISRKRFAKALNVSPPAVSKFLNGSPNFTIRTLLLMADVLKTELSIEFKAEDVTSSEFKHMSTASEDKIEDTKVESTENFRKIDLADTPAPWVIDAVTSAAQY
jgi:transcriptional regulator with XRE-family HTH domain